MIRQLAVWKLIADSLEQELPVMLLYVLESRRSSPGRQGFAMAVNTAGLMEGSIGGGIMEHKFVEMSGEKLREPFSQTSVRKQVHDKRAAKNQSGMICSGEQTILIYRVLQSDSEHIGRIVSTLENSDNCTLSFSPGGLETSDELPAENFFFNYRSESDWRYQEKLGYKNFLHIAGAGHCSFSLSRIMGMLDFYVHLYDDRPQLNTFHQNQVANKKTIIESYSQLQQLIPSGDDQYVAIMTVGYRTDDEAIKAMAGKNLRYIGLLGSQTKVNKLLIQHSDQFRKQIHAPVGLQIHSQTPEEIAVSIAAEIIAVKNAPAGS